MDIVVGCIILVTNAQVARATSHFRHYYEPAICDDMISSLCMAFVKLSNNLISL